MALHRFEMILMDLEPVKGLGGPRGPFWEFGWIGVPRSVGGSQGSSLGAFENSHFLFPRGEFVNGIMKY